MDIIKNSRSPTSRILVYLFNSSHPYDADFHIFDLVLVFWHWNIQLCIIYS